MGKAVSRRGGRDVVTSVRWRDAYGLRDKRASLVREAQVDIERFAGSRADGWDIGLVDVDKAIKRAAGGQQLHRASHVALSDRAPLRLVGLEQCRSRPSLQHPRQLPCEIVRVLDAGI